MKKRMSIFQCASPLSAPARGLVLYYPSVRDGMNPDFKYFVCFLFKYEVPFQELLL